MSSGDGRNIDRQLGTLLGEGSEQESRGDRRDEKGEELSVFGGVPGESTGIDPSYYDRPVIKRSVWSWSVPLYYYVGGTSGGSAVLGAAATIFGRGEYPNLVIRARWIGTIGGAISGVLLIYDLGRPSRFLNMLRVFRPTSPMNMGTWILTVFSTAVGFSAFASLGPAPLPRLGDLSAVKVGIFGLLLSGYTGVLVAHTVVPVWQRPHRTLPLLFVASAMAGAASLLNFFEWNESERRAIATFGAVGRMADLVCGEIVEKQIGTVPEAAKPLHEGVSGFLWQAGKALTATSLILTLLPGSSRARSRWTGVFGTAGALCLRFAIHYAGQRSAENPRATFHQQRAGQGAFEITGQAAITGPGERRAIGQAQD